MESNVQRFSVISRTPNSKDGNRAPLTPCQPISVMREPANTWIRPGNRGKHLPKHIIILEGKPTAYKCTVCSTSFRSRSNCVYHKNCDNDTEKPFTCSICNRKFSTKTHFSYHTLMHTGVNPFKCSECGKSFKTNYKLRRHQQVHTDTKKNFFCDICGRAFLRKTSIRVHQRMHNGEKPYKCNECHKAFREKKNLILHLSHHTGIKNWICEICGKSYSIKWELELHKRTHTRIRPFRCTASKCQQTFSQKRYLRRHMETHKNLVKFVCSICEKEFSRKDNLQRHIVNTHLESQNITESKTEKTKRLQLDTAPYIQTVKILDKNANKHIEKDEKNLTIRTESVIMSATKTGRVINFCSRSDEDSRNYVSVIQANSVGISHNSENGECSQTSDNHESEMNVAPLGGSNKNFQDAFPECSRLEFLNHRSVIRYNRNIDNSSENRSQSLLDDEDAMRNQFTDECSDNLHEVTYSCSNYHEDSNNSTLLSPKYLEASSNVNSDREQSDQFQTHENRLLDNSQQDEMSGSENPITNNKLIEISSDVQFENQGQFKLPEHTDNLILLKSFGSQYGTPNDSNAMRNEEFFRYCDSFEPLTSDNQKTSSCTTFNENGNTGKIVESTKQKMVTHYRTFKNTYTIVFPGCSNNSLENSSIQDMSDFDLSSSPRIKYQDRINSELHNRKEREEADKMEHDTESSSPTYHYLTNCSTVGTEIMDVPVYINSDGGRKSATNHVSETCMNENESNLVFEGNLKTRCLLPKKVIAASYRDSSILKGENTQAGVKTAININSWSPDSCKLLDLSMKSQHSYLE